MLILNNKLIDSGLPNVIVNLINLLIKMRRLDSSKFHINFSLTNDSSKLPEIATKCAFSIRPF